MEQRKGREGERVRGGTEERERRERGRGLEVEQKRGREGERARSGTEERERRERGEV